MGMLLVIDIIGVEACKDVQKCAWGRGYLRAADVSSFWTRADGVVGQMIYCTNNGRFYGICAAGWLRQHEERADAGRWRQRRCIGTRLLIVHIMGQRRHPNVGLRRFCLWGTSLWCQGLVWRACQSNLTRPSCDAGPSLDVAVSKRQGCPVTVRRPQTTAPSLASLPALQERWRRHDNRRKR